ncbi:unnamed protein product [Cladocopium goreaui]|uniref:Uncharacterized protein n=1 Tax=Cladocopium goreaui TaxID=2562237 RepID=A0A9P1DQR5_9DINO|nr:unnamed protein product [Cladocopium goreaui]
MNVTGLAAVWEADESLRERLRKDRKVCIHPMSQRWCEPSRVNAVNNSIVLLPALRRLRETDEWKLPYLEQLQVEIGLLFEKVSVPVDDKTVYTSSVEVKKLLGFVKRRAKRHEVLTRRQQLAAKKNGKNQEAAEGNGEGEAEGDHGDDDQNGQPVMKKPAARAKAAGKAKAAAKKQVQTEKATDAEPKAKSAAKRKARKSKAAEEQHEPEQEESEVPEGDQNLDSTKRRLFKDGDQDPPAPAEEAVGADPPRKRRKRRTPAADAADPSGQSKKSPEAKVKAKAAPRRRKGADGEDQKCEDGQEAQPKRRARKSRQQREAEEAVLASRMNMEDDVMKGVVLQVLREVKTMTVDELKDHLSSKKDSLAGKNSTLNVYWSRTNSRCKYLLDPATPDTANFYFTSGTWNTRMAAAFIGSWLMACWMDTKDEAVLSQWEDPTSEFAVEEAKIKFNVAGRWSMRARLKCKKWALKQGLDHEPRTADMFAATLWEDPPSFQWVEFFAGKAEATRMFRESHFRTGKLDITYMRPGKSGFNPMDLLTDSGFALAIETVLLGDHENGWVLDLGRLQGWAKKVRQDEAAGVERVKLVTKYIDKAGKKRYKGSASLRSSEHYPAKFGRKLVSIFSDLISDKRGLPTLPDRVPPAEETFSQMSFDDHWQDAQVVAVCHWLRGGKQLDIPQSFRDIIPKKL